MKKENVIQSKSYNFALKIIQLYKFLSQEKKEFVLGKQILRAGTSIGANIEESVGAQSKKDFLSKVSIAYKEARETKYWICLLRDTKILSIEQAKGLLNDCEELLKIMGKIQTTIKLNS